MYIFALDEVVMSLRGAYLFHAVNVPVAEAIVIFHFKVAPIHVFGNCIGKFFIFGAFEVG
jgi:hypothetical protein